MRFRIRPARKYARTIKQGGVMSFREARGMGQSVSSSTSESEAAKLHGHWRPRVVDRIWSLDVMTVDDDSADASLILHALRRNVQVRSVSAYTDPDAALVDLAEGRTRPELILLDIKMPKMSGFQFLDALRRIPAFAETQVVFLTTSRPSRDTERTQQTPACGYVIKPNSYHELHSRLDVTARRALKHLYPRGCR